MPWSEWQRFADMDMKVNPTEACKLGVYQVRATSDDRRPVPIPRACGIDTEGIPYIGRGFLPDRIGRLMRIFESDPKHHHNFISVFLKYNLERIGNRKCIEARWLECENPGAEEGRLIEDYKRRTGDIPPGNRKLETAPAEPSADVEDS